MKKITFLLVILNSISFFSQEDLQLLANINSSNQHCSPTFKGLNNTIFFDAGYGLVNYTEPWICNTTTGATSELIDINPFATPNFYSSTPYFIAAINNKMFFSANDGIHGFELWITDGTIAGTQLVKDINTGTGDGMLTYNCQSSGPVVNNPKNYGILNNKLIFEGFTNNGEQLWISDGTTTGTTLLKQIDPSTAFNGNIYFIQDFTLAGNKLFFTAVTNSASNRELWVTDGTTSGTFLTNDIYLGNTTSNPQNLTSFNNKIFFTANDGTHGTELWSSDGTTAGTTIVSDINAGAIGSNPTGLFVLNNKLFFLANNGSVGNELWVYDAGTDSTTLVKDTQPGTSGLQYISNLTIFNNLLFFIGDNQLWKTDGTTSGTTLVKGDLTSNTYGTNLIGFANKLYFGSNSLLWSSDGTPTGTLALPELPDASFINIQPYTEINGKLIITNYNQSVNTIGGKLWTCDSLQNINLVSLSGVSSYGDIFKYNDAFYFEGTNSNSYNLYRFGIPLNLATNDYTSHSSSIFPNPTSEFIDIQSENQPFENASLTITNTIGQTILKKDNINATSINIDVAFQPNGVYLLTIENKGVRTTQKIIKN